jgi:hypothetical protein
MLSILPPLLLILTAPAAAQTLSIVPSQIQAGENATLMWDVGADNAFVMGYGRVSGKGSAPIKPESTADYILIIERRTGLGYEYRKQRLTVTGGRGTDEFPSLTEFGAPSNGRRKKTSYVDFQVGIWEMLQAAGCKVRGDYVPLRRYVTIYTDYVLRPDLVSRSEKIRARRLALAVDVSEPDRDGQIVFGVRTRMEFQYRGETDWRWDKGNPIATNEALRFVRLFEDAK